MLHTVSADLSGWFFPWSCDRCVAECLRRTFLQTSAFPLWVALLCGALSCKLQPPHFPDPLQVAVGLAWVPSSCSAPWKLQAEPGMVWGSLHLRRISQRSLSFTASCPVFLRTCILPSSWLFGRVSPVSVAPSSLEREWQLSFHFLAFVFP